LKDLGSGVMERPYMYHVVQYSDESTTIGGPQSFVCLPDFSSGALRNSVMIPARVKDLQHIFEKFQTCETYSHGFLVGTGNHWVALVGNKFKLPTSEKSEIELIYMDSRNNPVMNASEEELQHIVNTHYERLEKRGIK